MARVDAPDGVMVFDELCVFCSTGVRLLLAADRRAAIRFTPIQSPYGVALALAAGIDPADPATFLFFDRGRALERSEAVLAMVRRLPAPWRWAAVARALPRRLRDGVYDWIARNRYGLFGRRRTCLLPTPAQAERLLLEAPR
jgi:predicted DCC family thiol-disulfide oxidoreductase YuxK